MGDIIRFVPRSERERTRLIREARAIYESIFPPTDPGSEQQNDTPANHAGTGSKTRRDGARLP
jgi:hypothetical protein